MKYYVDGFMAHSNPSPLGGGFTITDETGAILHQEVVKKEGYTNNDAELDAVLWALRNCDENDTISTDSMCIVTWVNAGKSKARRDLYDKMQEAKSLRESKSVNLMWEGREFNKAGIVNEKTNPQAPLLQYL